MSALVNPTIVLLDSGPLGLITNPKSTPEAFACKTRHRGLVSAGHIVLVPEIIDYEHRRELILAGLVRAERALDALKATGSFLPLTTDAMLQAARLWAAARRGGLPTAARTALDVDVILAAQAITLDSTPWKMPGAGVLIATTNLEHLARYAAADEWQNIVP